MLFLKFNENLYRQIPEERLIVLEMRSLTRHDAYHIGKIVFLSKMQGVWGGS